MKLQTHLMLRLTLALAFLCRTAHLNAENKEPEQALDLYLLIGQSNMAGRAPFTKEEAKSLDDGFVLNAKDQWEPAKNPLNQYSTIRICLLRRSHHHGSLALRCQKHEASRRALC